MTGRPMRALSHFAFTRSLRSALFPASAAALMLFMASGAAAQGFDPFGTSEPAQSGSGVTREELQPSAALQERERGVVREELDPVMSNDGSGLPHELWSGLSAEQFAKSIAALQLPPRSPALHALWRRLIGSDSTPADGVGNARFTALRVEALDQSGLVDEVAAVLAKDPNAERDPLLQALTARSEIGLGNTERGCEIGKSLRAVQSQLPKPIQADAMLINGYCAAAHGDTAGAALQASLLKELDLGLAGADFLDAVANSLTPQIPSGTKLTLLDYRIAALKGGLDRAKLIAAATPALLAGLAQDPHGAPDVRLAAGEAAAQLNALSARDLAPLYLVDGAGGDAGTIERAGVFREAQSQETPLQKARHIRAFLDDARRANLYWPSLQLMAPAVQDLEPVPEIGWFAETAIEVNLATGNFEGVRRWARLGDQIGAAGQPLAHWIALADIADPTPAPDRGQSFGALETMARNGRFDPALLHRLATVLDALDMNVPVPLWEIASRSPQPNSGHLPDTGVLSELADASQKKQFGRTVLLVMRTIGPQGAEGAHMIALGDALRALKRAGLDAEARQLALEGLLGAWPRSVSQ